MTDRQELWFYKSVASAEVGPYTGGSSSIKLGQVQQQNVFV